MYPWKEIENDTLKTTSTSQGSVSWWNDNYLFGYLFGMMIRDLALLCVMQLFQWCLAVCPCDPKQDPVSLPGISTNTGQPHIRCFWFSYSSWDLSCYSKVQYLSGLVKDCSFSSALIHWGWVTHIWGGKLTIIGSDNGLSPERRQAIIWTNAGILLIGPLGTNFSEILIEIQTFSLKKRHLKMSSAKWRPFCLGLDVLMKVIFTQSHHRYWEIAFEKIVTALSKSKAHCKTVVSLVG